MRSGSKVALLLIVCSSILLSCGVWRSITSETSNKLNYLETRTVEAFEKWSTAFGKSYRSPEEKRFRMKIFASSLKSIEEHNKDEKRSFDKGLNEISDIDSQEYTSRYNNKRNAGFDQDYNPLNQPVFISKVPRRQDQLSGMYSPESIDWSKSKATFGVRKISNCGACYAVSAIESVESALFFDKGISVELSVQNILDCTSRQPYMNQGCDGGSVIESFKYVRDFGVTTSEEYPFISNKTGIVNTCQSQKRERHSIKDFFQIVQRRSDVLRSFVAYRPLAVKINLPEDLKSYKSGIYMGENCSSIPNHFVTLVGYGEERNKQTGEFIKFWLIKNNMGDNWGEKGYLRLVREDGPVIGECGITESASFVSL